MSYIDSKYVNVVGSRLQRFHRVDDHTFAFRCPFCGDSKKSPNKTRGYLFEKGNGYVFKCFNQCGAKSFTTFLKEFDSSLYTQYELEKFVERKPKQKQLIVPVTKQIKSYDVGELKQLLSIQELNDSSVFKQYIIRRQIPEKHWRHIFLCQDFRRFVNQLLPGKIKEGKIEPRLIIPFFDENKQMFAFSGRSFNANSPLRYINIVLDERKPKLFGIDRWRKNETTIVVEGPLDSLFLDNCIATSGGDLVSAIRQYDRDRFIIVYDNEPRSISTRTKIDKAINLGYKVCIWPKSIFEKDINQMILEGRNALDIQRIICETAVSSLEAKLAFSFWR